jgi:hypothetical protein
VASAGLLQALLRQVEVAHQPDQGGERFGAVAAEGVVDAGGRAAQVT